MNASDAVGVVDDEKARFFSVVRVPKMDPNPNFDQYSFNLLHKYKNSSSRQVVGFGSQGIVFSGEFNGQPREPRFVIKYMRLFDENRDAGQVLTGAKRAYREVNLMKKLRHVNVLRMKNIFTPQANWTNFTDLYIDLDPMDCNLFQLLMDTKEKKERLQHKHISWFLFQIFSGLDYLDEKQITHRDLSANNIGVRNVRDLDYLTHIVILDFGCARFLGDDKNQTRTAYIVTRNYRAPEILLNRSQYSRNADIWSVGCLMAEMMLLSTLFPNSHTTTEHIYLLFSTIVAPESYIDTACSLIRECGKYSDEKVARMCDDLKASRKVKNDKLRAKFTPIFGSGEDSIDSDSIMCFNLLRILLEIQPERRFASIKEYLKQDYLNVPQWRTDMARLEEHFGMRRMRDDVVDDALIAAYRPNLVDRRFVDIEHNCSQYINELREQLFNDVREMEMEFTPGMRPQKRQRTLPNSPINRKDRRKDDTN